MTLVVLVLPILSFTNLAAAMSTLEGAAARESMVASYSVAPTSNLTSLRPHSRRRRSLLFPEGSDLSFNMGLSLPISALSETSESRSGRGSEEVYTVEAMQWCFTDLLNRGKLFLQHVLFTMIPHIIA